MSKFFKNTVLILVAFGLLSAFKLKTHSDSFLKKSEISDIACKEELKKECCESDLEILSNKENSLKFLKLQTQLKKSSENSLKEFSSSPLTSPPNA